MTTYTHNGFLLDTTTGALVVTGVDPSAFYPESYGAVGDGVTDDSAAIGLAVDAVAAISSGLASNGGAAVQLQAGKTYLCNAAPRTDRNGNAIIALPNTQKNVRIEGNGAYLLCTRTTDVYDATHGSPSVIGGPTPEQALGNLPVSGAVTIRNLNVIVPKNTKIAGIDLHYCQGEILENVAVIASGTAAGTVDTLNTAVYVFGIRHAAGNYGLVIADGVFSNGLYCGHVIHGSHTHFKHVYGGNCTVGVGFVGGDGHATVMDYVMTEHCINHFAGWEPVAGVRSPPAAAPFYLMASNWDIEDGNAPFATTSHILDTNSMLTGDATVMRWGGLATAETLTVTGGWQLNWTPTATTTWRKASIQSGTHANRLTSVSQVGHEYAESDTGVRYLGAGVFSWAALDRHGMVPKSADQTVNNSAALANDTHLKFPIEANEIWFVHAYFKVVSVSVNSDFKAGWSLPAGATAEFILVEATAAAAASPTAVSSTMSAGGINGTYFIEWKGWIVNSSTAGTAQFQWAQNTATVENTILKKGSLLHLVKAI